MKLEVRAFRDLRGTERDPLEEGIALPELARCAGLSAGPADAMSVDEHGDLRTRVEEARVVRAMKEPHVVATLGEARSGLEIDGLLGLHVRHHQETIRRRRLEHAEGV